MIKAKPAMTRIMAKIIERSRRHYSEKAEAGRQGAVMNLIGG